MGQGTEEQLTRNIEGTREDLSRDLDALTDKISPSQIMERRKEATKSRFRSVRDKVMTYFGERISEQEDPFDTLRTRPFDRMFKVANAFAEDVRRVSREDRDALEESGLRFNIHCLLGGQMAGDAEPKLYLIYPQGNWVEAW